MEIGRFYSFSTHAPNILGEFKNVELISIGNFTSALSSFQMEIMNLISVMNPYIPSEVDKNSKKHVYYTFLDNSGNKKVVSDAWIIKKSIEEKLTKTLEIIILNPSLQSEGNISNYLRLSGYDFTIKK